MVVPSTLLPLPTIYGQSLRALRFLGSRPYLRAAVVSGEDDNVVRRHIEVQGTCKFLDAVCREVVREECVCMRSELSEELVLRRKAVIGTAGETSGPGGTLSHCALSASERMTDTP